jgi:hypothetical protein
MFGIYALITPLHAHKQRWDQSLGLYLLEFTATPIYGSSLDDKVDYLYKS